MYLPTYCKRLRMEVDLRWIDPVPPLPSGCVWVPWDDSVLRDHADVKFRSFCGEMDTLLFPNLATPGGCVQLMELIRAKPGFLSEATWLIAARHGCCGTIQGVLEESGCGAIQNIGVLPDCRGRGLGRALLLKALEGFRRRGAKRAWLEVSARNRTAARLYHQIGFIVQKTLYREFAAEPEHEYAI